MSTLSLLLYVLAALHLLIGAPAMLAPGFVRTRLPPRYAEAVGERRQWRGFGMGVTSVGISLLLIAGALGS
ncbi:hypothetical protein HALDL1_10545 [Halobacterium sp. DL1]|nr:hypothetical protein HALDL1_10545 [Halobacterium sp. DL1]